MRGARGGPAQCAGPAIVGPEDEGSHARRAGVSGEIICDCGAGAALGAAALQRWQLPGPGGLVVCVVGHMWGAARAGCWARTTATWRAS